MLAKDGKIGSRVGLSQMKNQLTLNKELNANVPSRLDISKNLVVGSDFLPCSTVSSNT